MGQRSDVGGLRLQLHNNGAAFPIFGEPLLRVALSGERHPDLAPGAPCRPVIPV